MMRFITETGAVMALLESVASEGSSSGGGHPIPSIDDPKYNKEATPSTDVQINGKVFKNALECKPLNQWNMEELTKPDPIYLFSPLILEKELTVLFADTGIGKTVYAMQMAVEIAQKGYKTLYVDLELSAKQCQKRFTNENRELKKVSEQLHRAEFARIDTPLDIDWQTYFFNSLREWIKIGGFQVVFLDNMTMLSGSDTDTARGTIPLLNELNAIKRDFGQTIIVLEHTRKTDKNSPIELNHLQGSKQKANLIDGAFSIGRSSLANDLRYVKQVKVRDGVELWHSGNVMSYQMTKEGGHLHFKELQTTSEAEHIAYNNDKDRAQQVNDVRQLLQEGKKQKEIAEQLGISQAKVSRLSKETPPETQPETETPKDLPF